MFRVNNKDRLTTFMTAALLASELVLHIDFVNDGC